MKRDPDLIRKILLEVKSCDNPQGISDSRDIQIEGYSAELTQYNVGLLVDTGLVSGIKSNEVVRIDFYINVKLATAGYDYLDLRKEVYKEMRNKVEEVKEGNGEKDVIKRINYSIYEIKNKIEELKEKAKRNDEYQMKERVIKGSAKELKKEIKEFGVN